VEINETPRAKLSAVNKMQETVKAHAKLGIRCESVDWFEEWMVPTYDMLIESAQEDAPFETLRRIEQSIPDVTEADVDELITEIETLAKIHAEAGYRYTELEPYERLRYERALEQQVAELGIEIEQLEPTSESNPANCDTLIDSVQEDLSLETLTRVEQSVLDVAEVDIDDLTTEIEDIAKMHIKTGDRCTELEQHEWPRYERTIEERAVESEVEVESTEPETETESDPVVSTGGSGDGEVFEFGPFDQDERETIEQHLGELSGLSPEQRRDKLLRYVEAVDSDAAAVRDR
jgi:hypothetical protein